MSAPRVGLIGARRRRQGLGPFVAGFLVEAGAEVPAFLGTRAETLAQASRDLHDRIGVWAKGYIELDRLLAEHPLDGLAILSPSETHAGYLERALEAGLHVFCEKPLVWGEPGLARRGAALVARFAESRRLLHENCQWPYTLPSFEALHPGVLAEPLQSFGMRLTPMSRGADMLGDSLPHPLSLLQALAPSDAPGVANVRLPPHPEPEGIAIHFDYHSGPAKVAVEVELLPSDRAPRKAAYGVNGRWVDRAIRVSDYALSFVNGSRSVPVADPLRQSVSRFVSALRGVGGGDVPEPSGEVAARMAMLEGLLEAYHAGEAA
ncbi:MAG: Gfo/Idh/MocA family oxidoreductase [Myxococcota bacterium]